MRRTECPEEVEPANSIVVERNCRAKRNPRHKSQNDQFGDARRQDSDQCQKCKRDRADDDKTSMPEPVGQRDRTR